jgi:hypothetical protein
MEELYKAKDLKELKTAYKMYAKQFHPDTGGDEAKFIELQALYKKLLQANLSSGIMETIIDELYDDDLDIEIIGTFIWVGGSTYQHKDKLKSLGFKWASKKKLWFWTEVPSFIPKSKKKDIEEIRGKYGSKKVKGRTAIAS